MQSYENSRWKWEFSNSILVHFSYDRRIPCRAVVLRWCFHNGRGVRVAIASGDSRQEAFGDRGVLPESFPSSGCRGENEETAGTEKATAYRQIRHGTVKPENHTKRVDVFFHVAGGVRGEEEFLAVCTYNVSSIHDTRITGFLLKVVTSVKHEARGYEIRFLRKRSYFDIVEVKIEDRALCRAEAGRQREREREYKYITKLCSFIIECFAAN